MKELPILARPYAKAAFDFALANNALKEWSESLNNAATIISNEHFKLLINNPKISRDELTHLIFSILGDALDEHKENFIQLLIQNHRLNVLPDIASKFSALYDNTKKQTNVQVTSAYPLTDEQKQKIEKALEKRLELKVNLTCETDTTILSGAIIRSGDRVFNYSGRFILNELATSLRGNN